MYSVITLALQLKLIVYYFLAQDSFYARTPEYKYCITAGGEQCDSYVQVYCCSVSIVVVVSLCLPQFIEAL